MNIFQLNQIIISIADNTAITIPLLNESMRSDSYVEDINDLKYPPLPDDFEERIDEKYNIALLNESMSSDSYVEDISDLKYLPLPDDFENRVNEKHSIAEYNPSDDQEYDEIFVNFDFESDESLSESELIRIAFHEIADQ
jgi:hypothetical protein